MIGTDVTVTRTPPCLHPWTRPNVGRGTTECGVCGVTVTDPFEGL